MDAPRRLVFTVALALSLGPAATGCTGREGDPVQESLDLATTYRLCERCGLFSSARHKCGETAYCTGCYTKAIGDNAAYLAEGKFKVDPSTRTATCDVCGQVVGQRRE